MNSEFKNCFRKCSAGAVAVTTALVLPVLIGIGSLGVEVGHWYLGQREMQGAADAAAISAAAQYIADFPSNPNSTTYQTVGVSYALTNGFTIPIANVCLVSSSGNNCGTVLSLDSRALVCATPPCVVVEITQNTATWLTTKASFMPGTHVVQAIPTPTLKARAIVSATAQTQTTTTKGTDCILALANDAAAVTVHGNGNLEANCGLAIDGGRDQNVSGTAVGGITFNGAPSSVHISNLIVAANGTDCPGAHCFLYNPSTSALPASQVFTKTATADPYAAQIAALFQTTPLGVKTGGVALKTAGTGYTNGTCTFTVTGGTYYTATASPAKFTATISGGKVTAIVAVTDPGAYATFPSGSVSAAGTCGSGTTAATFTLTEGCFTWNVTPIAGRKYCSINLNGSGTTNFPAGTYWIAGGDSCPGFCVSSNNATVTSDAAGVTFLLTNGEGSSANAYATVAITSGSVSLCAPGTSTGATCTTTNFGTQCSNSAGSTSCLLFVQNPAATTSTSDGNPSSTSNTFSGNGTRTLSGLIYLPKQTFAETGNGPINGCVGIIAKYIDVGGTPLFSNGCLPGNGIGGTTTTVTTLGTPKLYQ